MTITKPVYDLLTAAQNKIRDPNNWTQHVSARDAHQREAAAVAPEATCWCSTGAIEAIQAPYIHHEVATRLLICAAKLLDHNLDGWDEEIIYQFNDTRTHTEVMAMWELARRMTHTDDQSSL